MQMTSPHTVPVLIVPSHPSAHLCPSTRAMRKEGKAFRWNDERGFGFIKQADGGADVFCHRSALGEDRQACLTEGETVYTRFRCKPPPL